MYEEKRKKKVKQVWMRQESFTPERVLQIIHRQGERAGGLWNTFCP
jgi:hypothetical protein